jgi:hypothetical protein
MHCLPPGAMQSFIESSATLADRAFFQMGQTKSENQNSLWNFPKCCLNPNLDCFDSEFAVDLVKNQKHHNYWHFGINSTYSNYADGTP